MRAFFPPLILLLALAMPSQVEAYNIDGYPSYYTYVNRMEAYANAHPDIAKMVAVGQGERGYGQTQGHTIWALKVSDNVDVGEDEAALLFSGLHHPKEPISIEAVMQLLDHVMDNYGTDPEITDYVNELELWFLPILNPDGYLYLKGAAPAAPYWRKNLRDNDGDGIIDYNYDGVDLNRNYPYNWANSGSGYPGDEDYRGPWAGSEAEVQAYMDLALQQHFLYSLTYHSYANTMDYCWGLDGWEIPETPMMNEHFGALASLVPAYGGGTVSPLGSDGSAGFSYNWMFARAGVLEGQVEIGGSFIPSYSNAQFVGNQQRASQLQVMDYALNGPGIRGHVLDAETGEPLDATVRILQYYSPLYMGARVTHPDNGSFFRRTSVSSYTVEAYAPGYEVQRISNVVVEDGAWTDVEIELQRGVPADYEQDFSGAVTGWEPDRGSWEILGGVLRHLTDYGEDRSASYQEYAFTDYSYQAKVRLDNGDFAGITFNGPTGTSNCYVFYMRANEQNARLVQKVGHETWILAETAVGSATLYEDQWYTMRVDVSGSHFDCYIDSQLLLSHTDDDGMIFYGGKIGTWVSETLASFDDIHIEDRDQPMPPSGVASASATGRILLDWDNNTELDLDGYKVYASSSEEGPFDLLTPTLISESQYLVGDLGSEESLYFYVTAQDFAEHESLPSDILLAQEREQVLTLVVEDDNRFYHEAYIQDPLMALNHSHFTFDAISEGRAPLVEELLPFDLVIWFCGDDGLSTYFWNGNDTDNEALASYLEQDGSLWVIGLDLLYDRYGSAPETFEAGDFCYDVLGLQSYEAQSWANDGSVGLAQLDLDESFSSWQVDPITWTTATGVLKYVDAVLGVEGSQPIYGMGPEGYALEGSTTMIWNDSPGARTLGSYFNIRYIDGDTERQQVVADALGLFEMAPIPLLPVDDLHLQQVEGGMQLNWTAVEGATAYIIRSSDAAYGEFLDFEIQLDGSQTQWLDTETVPQQGHRFYRVWAQQ